MQSNSIQISPNLYNFDENSIVLQVDPKTTNAFQVCFNDFFKNHYTNLKNRFNTTKKELSNRYYENIQNKKRQLFVNEFNYLKTKRDFFNLNNLGISKSIEPIINFSKEEKMFRVEYNVYSLKNVKD